MFILPVNRQKIKFFLQVILGKMGGLIIFFENFERVETNVSTR